MLTVENLTAGYGQLKVLHDVSLTVPAGEVVSVLGANGAGKTTLLRAVSGLMRYQGRVSMGDNDLSNIPAEKLVRCGISHVPENRLIFGGLTVEDNLDLGAWSLRRRRTRSAHTAQKDKVLSLFPALASRRSQAAGTMSGGEQQMLAIARSLMVDPTTLLLDEPSVGLAPRVVAEIFSILSRLAAEGISVLVVEQNARTALKHSSKVYVLDRGRVAAQGDPDTLESSGELHAAYFGTRKDPASEIAAALDTA